ncbi:MAG: beta-aspartyl-peptidase [Xanthomonadales bacterium]|jgi:beta-aspartyl-dipeptidase (metallo-type)|nr:beta-aspartyl-peptidase [Xanthomonadales bacterium]
MLTLIRKAHLIDPEPLGFHDVLIAGSRIARVAPQIDLSGSDVNIIEAEGRWLLPGFVDVLTHPCGGGGEGGFGNRTAELEAADFLRAGITTPVGALGTDSITRRLEVLYGQVMKLRAHGLSALMYSGSYRVPVATLTGDVARDLVLVEPVVGLGELAIADHRSSHPTAAELLRIASDVHLGGTLSGKGGTLFLHVGDARPGLEPIEIALEQSELPRRLFYPTHCNRRAGLLEQSIEHVKHGGFADFTVSTTPEFIEAGEVPALEALRSAIDAGASAKRLTFSSDAGGSLPHYVGGELTGLRPARPDSLLDLLRSASGNESHPPADIVAAMTRNPASALKLPRKGCIEPGADADLLLMDPAGAQLNDVFSLGQRLMKDGNVNIPMKQAHEEPRS